jgi:hypothetical protein
LVERDDVWALFGWEEHATGTRVTEQRREHRLLLLTGLPARTIRC